MASLQASATQAAELLGMDADELCGASSEMKLASGVQGIEVQDNETRRCKLLLGLHLRIPIRPPPRTSVDCPLGVQARPRNANITSSDSCLNMLNALRESLLLFEF